MGARFGTEINGPSGRFTGAVATPATLDRVRERFPAAVDNFEFFARRAFGARSEPRIREFGPAGSRARRRAEVADGLAGVFLRPLPPPRTAKRRAWQRFACRSDDCLNQ